LQSAKAISAAELGLFKDVGRNPHLEAPELFQPRLITFLKAN
jgi:hypothetical protein